jgi:hypothetical protein
MKVTELRIWNLVEYNSCVFKVSEIRSPKPLKDLRYTDKYIIELFDGGLIDVLLDDISPIPLTEEWFLQFGFNKTRDEASPYKDGEDTIIGGRFTVFSKLTLTHNSVHGWFFNKHQQPEWNIKYIHQLQNLYFALTGEELKKL